MHNARGDLTGVLRSDGWGELYLFDGCQNRVYFAATQHGAALAAAVDKAARERSTYGEITVDRLAAQFPHQEQTQAYEAGDRVVMLSRSDGSKTELAYDANGQVTSKTTTRGADVERWLYGWNARGELVSLRTPNGKVWTYRYDGAGRRIQKKGPTGDTWRYVWMGHVPLHVLRNGELAETYVHEPGGTCPVLRDDGNVHFILPDQNDSPSEEIGADGSLEWKAQKGTWGERFSMRGAAGGEPFLGQWYDAESGLHYNYFRYYDPETGRYLSPDPIDLLGGLNAYACVSDPVRQYDRFGLNKGKCQTTEADPPGTPQETADVVELVNPADLRWSQTTAGGKGRGAQIRESMSAKGWDGPPIDVVRTPDGLVTVDHTRAAVALELGITQVPARVHAPSDALPSDMLTRPWNRSGATASTWGEAVELRGAGQSPSIGPTGSPTPPKLRS
jgi:RHS repeat-associated protein